MYKVDSHRAEEFICHTHILDVIEQATTECSDSSHIEKILIKGALGRGLTHLEAATLLGCKDPKYLTQIYKTAGELRDKIYGRRIVLFAPLYLSNYCVNSCTYCPYHHQNRDILRKKLTQEEISNEVKALTAMGHKRLALEAGEHPQHSPIEYILESIKTIYKSGDIRRVNVNIAATSVEEYRLLKEAEIGTYILFQETYNMERYKQLHPRGPKSNYHYHTEAMDRAMEAGIEDVGIGALLGLTSYMYDVIGLLMHSEHLEARFGVGPHTISLPRICPGDDVSLNDYPNAIDDQTFKHIVAVLRIARPSAGMIISTREKEQMRSDLLRLGITQLSGGSRTTVGGYYAQSNENSAQFEISDHRSLDEVTGWLLDHEHIPSFCTACYREGRTGAKFMSMVGDGIIAKCCAKNAIITLNEYLHNSACSPETRAKGEKLIKEM